MQQGEMRFGLTFVNILNTLPSKDEKDDDAPTIRSHAMREVRRRRKILQSQGRKHAAKHADPTIARKPFRTQDLSKSSVTREAPSPVVVLPPNLGNFNDLSLDTVQHLDYFIHGFTPLTFPTAHIRHECDILAIALTVRSPGLLHALCVLSIAHRNLLEKDHLLKDPTQPKIGSALGVSFLHHKNNAIAWLHKSLSVADTTRSTLCQAIIILLLIVESVCGDSLTANTHKTGLKEVITYTKQGPGIRPLMLSDMIMADLKSAAASSSEPTIKPKIEWVAAFDKLKCSPFEAHRTDLASLGTGFLTPASQKILGAQLVTLLCGMRQLVNALEKHIEAGKDFSNIDGSYFLVLEHELLLYKSFSENASASDESIRRCCRLAALLYFNLCIWKWPKNSTLVRNLSKDLCSAVSEWTTRSPANEHLSLVLWFNFMGTFSASNEDELAWFRKGMVAVSKMMRLTTDSQLHIALQTFFCADATLTEHVGICYQEMEHSLPHKPPINFRLSCY